MSNPLATKGLRDLAPRYDALLCDIWGVLHNGIEKYAEAEAALIAFREAGGRVVLISNAARPEPAIRAMLTQLNISDAAFDGLVTSGDVTRDLMRPYEGRSVHHVGPASDNSMFDGLDVTKSDVASASAVVVTGLDDPSDALEAYDGRMRDWLANDLPFICANPDKVVEIGDRLVYCPGALADIYTEMGGAVLQAGKPHRAIYEAALGRLGTPTISKSRIMGVGDSVRTDATGAADFGIDLLFITGSIHAAEIDAFGAADGKAIEELVAPSGAQLAGYMPRLIW